RIDGSAAPSTSQAEIGGSSSSSASGSLRSLINSCRQKLASRSPVEWARYLLTEPGAPVLVAVPLLLAEILVCALIVWRVPYTEIDWRAYMQEGFLNGTRDYRLLSGDTGPLVYPAGFCAFAAIYLTNTAIVLLILPPYWPGTALPCSCAAYPIECILSTCCVYSTIQLLCYSFTRALLCFLYDRWSVGCVLYSLAVSVKMNILLYAPGLLLLLLMRHHVWEVAGQLSVCALIQLLLGAPFLTYSTSAYLGRAFEFSRQFLFKWTVNWRFLPEAVFHNRLFHAGLLTVHLTLLLVFLLAYARTRRLSISRLIRFHPLQAAGKQQGETVLPAVEDIACVLFVSNFIGVVCARSLHYQFYFALSGLAVQAARRPPQLLLLGCIELCWNTYPSTSFSSGLLHCCHAVMIVLLMLRLLRPAAVKTD
uniref:dolichyl-P-Man:Man5GlcNAc2-PP-dolichol alpha-1,3-mannosyltransferase n=1 Tax=Macrostomum lignano TaxID=282301 RepID=A0A1I8FGB3_9PLAT